MPISEPCSLINLTPTRGSSPLTSLTVASKSRVRLKTPSLFGTLMIIHLICHPSTAIVDGCERLLLTWIDIKCFFSSTLHLLPGKLEWISMNGLLLVFYPHWNLVYFYVQKEINEIRNKVRNPPSEINEGQFVMESSACCCLFSWFATFTNNIASLHHNDLCGAWKQAFLCFVWFAKSLFKQQARGRWHHGNFI